MKHFELDEKKKQSIVIRAVCIAVCYVATVLLGPFGLNQIPEYLTRLWLSLILCCIAVLVLWGIEILLTCMKLKHNPKNGVGFLVLRILVFMLFSDLLNTAAITLTLHGVDTYSGVNHFAKQNVIEAFEVVSIITFAIGFFMFIVEKNNLKAEKNEMKNAANEKKAIAMEEKAIIWKKRNSILNEENIVLHDVNAKLEEKIFKVNERMKTLEVQKIERSKSDNPTILLLNPTHLEGMPKIKTLTIDSRDFVFCFKTKSQNYSDIWYLNDGVVCLLENVRITCKEICKQLEKDSNIQSSNRNTIININYVEYIEERKINKKNEYFIKMQGVEEPHKCTQLDLNQFDDNIKFQSS